MLILSRKEGEEIMIGDDIRIMVVGHNTNGQVMVGIDAPSSLPIARMELYPMDARPYEPAKGLEFKGEDL